MASSPSEKHSSTTLSAAHVDVARLEKEMKEMEAEIKQIRESEGRVPSMKLKAMRELKAAVESAREMELANQALMDAAPSNPELEEDIRLLEAELTNLRRQGPVPSSKLKQLQLLKERLDSGETPAETAVRKREEAERQAREEKAAAERKAAQERLRKEQKRPTIFAVGQKVQAVTSFAGQKKHQKQALAGAIMAEMEQAKQSKKKDSIMPKKASIVPNGLGKIAEDEDISQRSAAVPPSAIGSRASAVTSVNTAAKVAVAVNKLKGKRKESVDDTGTMAPLVKMEMDAKREIAELSGRKMSKEWI